MRNESAKSRPVRPAAETNVICRAKSVLMSRKNMSEAEAHRYLQKTSMNTSRSMVETAQMVLFFAGMNT